jgi:hypothetical protein
MYYGMVYVNYMYFVENEELIGTYADMIAAGILNELLQYQVQEEDNNVND